MCYLHFQLCPFHNIRDGGDLESLQEMRIWATSFNSYIQRQICQELVPSLDTLDGGGEVGWAASQPFPLSMKI